MMSLLQRKSLKLLHPFLKRLAKLYLSVPRKYNYEGITMRILPGVFHPGLFYSTNVLLEFLSSFELQKKKVLELGAGSGLISIYCASEGAEVTASDINDRAIKCIKENATRNGQSLEIVQSDLFEQLNPNHFDLIVINPPYYPRTARNEEEKAWFCGENFEYFESLFVQIKETDFKSTSVYMILSEDCDFKTISNLGNRNDICLDEVYSKKIGGEENSIYKFRNN